MNIKYVLHALLLAMLPTAVQAQGISGMGQVSADDVAALLQRCDRM